MNIQTQRIQFFTLIFLPCIACGLFAGTASVEAITTATEQSSDSSLPRVDRCYYLSSFDLRSISDNIGLTLRQINLSAYYQDEKLAGYWIKHVVPNSIFHQYGLKKDDLILSLNAVGINDSIAWAQEVQLLLHLTDFTLQIERQRQNMTLGYILDGTRSCEELLQHTDNASM